MGRMGLQSMIEWATTENALIWHLTANHYPPLPVSLVATCLAAIDCANMDEWDTEVELPEGALINGKNTVRAGDIIEDLHLHDFIEYCWEE